MYYNDHYFEPISAHFVIILHKVCNMHIKIGPGAEKQEVEIHENRRILLYQKTYTKYLVITKVFQNTTCTRLKIRFVCTFASIYFIQKNESYVAKLSYKV